MVYEAEDPGIASVEPGGRVRPAGDGATRVTVRAAGRSATVRVVVEDFAGRRPVAFAGEVVPIFTRAGCNAGTCHGRASGQNGFRLGLRGFDPRLDYESLTREGRGRRVFPSAPESSLVLRKPTAQVPHGGGRRFDVGSPEYRTIARWIAQGMPFEPEREPTVERIVVSPGRRRLARGSGQQLRVTADRTDGTSADVTHQAQYQSNAPDLAVVDERGRVEARDGAGEAAIVARFAGRVAVARITVSLEDGRPPVSRRPRGTSSIGWSSTSSARWGCRRAGRAPTPSSPAARRSTSAASSPTPTTSMRWSANRPREAHALGRPPPGAARVRRPVRHEVVGPAPEQAEPGGALEAGDVRLPCLDPPGPGRESAL